MGRGWKERGTVQVPAVPNAQCCQRLVPIVSRITDGRTGSFFFPGGGWRNTLGCCPSSDGFGGLDFFRRIGGPVMAVLVYENIWATGRDSARCASFSCRKSLAAVQAGELQGRLRKRGSC